MERYIYSCSSSNANTCINAIVSTQHFVAPDYPDWGSPMSTPSPGTPSPHTFKNIAEIISEIIEGLMESPYVNNHALYILNYTAPMSLRLAVQKSFRDFGYYFTEQEHLCGRTGLVVPTEPR